MGKFITFEGPDGAGKTTVLKNVVERLKTSKFEMADFVITREPGGSKVSNQIRDIVLNQVDANIDINTEVLLFAAARRQHVVEKIVPALTDGKTVISDRFLDSSVAYQGGGRQFGLDKVLDINQYATGGLEPDVTFYLKLEPEVGLKRINTTRTGEINRLDEENMNFYRRTVKAYDQIIESNPQRFVVVDANRPLPQVVDEVWSKFLNVM
ncbi:dTMP kinase [Lactiplantibacillus pentosus]|uniref:dTMP kinase n=1 Tax=Lactiplantibacillus pentosus TaxID=1589 RepID=UPI0031E72E7E